MTYLLVPPNTPRTIESTIGASLERLVELFRMHLWENKHYPHLSVLQLQIISFLDAWQPASTRPVMTDLADTFHLSKATISISLRNLIEKGLIYKKASERDKRRALLYLTEAGHDVAVHLKGFSQHVLATIGQLNPKKRMVLLTSLLELLHQFQLNGIISVEGMCFMCSFFSETANGQKIPYCELLKKPLSETSFPTNWYTL